MIDLGPRDLVSESYVGLATLFERANPLTHIVEMLSEISGIRPSEAQCEGEHRRAFERGGEQSSTLPICFELARDIRRRGPTGRRRHAVRAARSARYSSIVRLRSSESRPSSLCTNPTLAT